MIVQNPIIWLASNLIQAYVFVVFVYIITQMLVQFGYADRRHPLTIFIMNIGGAIVEPVLRKIRNIVPPISNLDLSPIILIIGLQFVLRMIIWVLYKLGLG